MAAEDDRVGKIFVCIINSVAVAFVGIGVSFVDVGTGVGVGLSGGNSSADK